MKVLTSKQNAPKERPRDHFERLQQMYWRQREANGPLVGLSEEKKTQILFGWFERAGKRKVTAWRAGGFGETVP